MTQGVNRPLKTFFKVIQGGLGEGNMGLLMSRHGTGKASVLVSLSVDHAMEGKNSLHVAVGKSVRDVRSHHDQVFRQLVGSLNLPNREALCSLVNRHQQFYTFREGAFDTARLAQTLDFLEEHAEFVPEVVEITGWPDFRKIPRKELESLKALALERRLKIWLTAHTKRDDEIAPGGLPVQLDRVQDLFTVLISLEPQGEDVRLNFLKVKDQAPAARINLLYDPATQLLRWY